MLAGTYDDGRYFLRVDPSRLSRDECVMLRVHPSVDGEPYEDVVLYELEVHRLEVDKAPGQTWPGGYNRPKMLPLPFDSIEEYDALGPELGFRVMHVLTSAYQAEVTGKSHTGVIWREPNLGVVPAWEKINDALIIRSTMRKMGL